MKHVTGNEEKDGSSKKTGEEPSRKVRKDSYTRGCICHQFWVRDFVVSAQVQAETMYGHLTGTR